MCNLYSEKVSYRQLVDEFSQLRLPIVLPGPEAAPNLPALEEVRPTDVAPIVRAAEGGAELAQLKWGFAASAPKRPPVINFRSEGRRFGRGRCLIPASCFFEFTGDKYPKTRWRFTEAGRDWFCLAGLWRPFRAGGLEAPFQLGQLDAAFRGADDRRDVGGADLFELGQVGRGFRTRQDDRQPELAELVDQLPVVHLLAVEIAHRGRRVS